MKMNYENVIEVNDELDLNIDKQQDVQQCDMDNEHEVQKITAARKIMGLCMLHVTKHLKQK